LHSFFFSTTFRLIRFFFPRRVLATFLIKVRRPAKAFPFSSRSSWLCRFFSLSPSRYMVFLFRCFCLEYYKREGIFFFSPWNVNSLMDPRPLLLREFSVSSGPPLPFLCYLKLNIEFGTPRREFSLFFSISREQSLVRLFFFCSRGRADLSFFFFSQATLPQPASLFVSTRHVPRGDSFFERRLASRSDLSFFSPARGCGSFLFFPLRDLHESRTIFFL